MTAYEHDSMQLDVTVHFRIAEKEDIPRLEWYGQYRHYRNLFRRAYREQLQGRRLILVADYNHFPIGHVFVQFASANNRIADGKTRAYFYSFRVMEIFQGQGIGTRLMQEAELLLIESGYKRVTIAVVKDNYGALRLYDRLGYFKIGEDPGRWSYTDHLGRINKVEEPCWVLEKNLNMS